MIAALSHLKMPRGTLFVVFNVAAVLFVVMFLVAPILAHFASRGEDISENAEQLAHFQNVVRSRRWRPAESGGPAIHFFPAAKNASSALICRLA